MAKLTDNMTFGTFMAPFHRVGKTPPWPWNATWN